MEGLESPSREAARRSLSSRQNGPPRSTSEAGGPGHWASVCSA